MHMKLFLVIFLGCSVAFGGDDKGFKSTKAKTAQKKFDKAVDKAKKEYEKKVATAKKTYVKELKIALKDAMKKGKLDEAKKIDAIIKEDVVEKIIKEKFLLKNFFGQWLLRFTNGTTVLYSINKEKIELSQNGRIIATGRIVTDKKEHQLVIRYSHGKIEKIKLSNGLMSIKHFRTEQEFRTNKPYCVGSGSKSSSDK